MGWGKFSKNIFIRLTLSGLNRLWFSSRSLLSPVISVTFSGTIAPGLKQSFRVFATLGKISSKFLESLHLKSSGFSAEKCLTSKALKQSSVILGGHVTLGDHSYITSSHFWDFWTSLPPYVSMFLVLRISKNWHFLTPLPPYKCWRNIWMVPYVSFYFCFSNSEPSTYRQDVKMCTLLSLAIF